MYTKSAQLRHELEGKLIERAVADATFRQLLLKDPRKAVEAELGINIPQGTKVTVLEESSDTLCLVLPVPASEELSEQDLESVVGGDLKVGSGAKFEQPLPSTCGPRG